jgi:dipeptidyl aminopeptidase/acylaminoacyl peptidase
MIMRRTLIAIGAVAAWLLVAAPTAFATFPGANGRIAYTSGDGTIHTILPDGHGDVSTGRFGTEPAWSPDGRRIAYLGNAVDHGVNKQEIFSMAKDGSDVRRLTYLAGHEFPYLGGPSYSPDGRRIAFTKVGNAVNLMVMGSDGSNPHRIHSGDAFEWSPGGRWISYRAERALAIWEVHPNGTDAHQLVRLGSAGGWLSDYAPSGKQFIFVRRNDYPGDSAEVPIEYDHTFIARADGSHVHRLPCADSPPGIPFTGGVFSPNGRWLLGARPVNGAGDLLKLDLRECRAGKVLYQTVATGNGYGPFDWQPLPTP